MNTIDTETLKTETTKTEIPALYRAYIAAGYRKVSNKGHVIARIDRVDWQVVIKDESNPVLLLNPGLAAADHYRRCYSKDTITFSREEWEAGARLIPTSGHDPVGFIHPDGTEDPGYEVVLVPKRSTLRDCVTVLRCMVTLLGEDGVRGQRLAKLIKDLAYTDPEIHFHKATAWVQANFPPPTDPLTTRERAALTIFSGHDFMDPR